MKRFPLLVLALGMSTLSACDGLKEALTAHVDVAARAGSQELSVTRLSDMLGKATLQVPVNKEVATLLARDLWVPYQLLGLAAARGDSLADPKAIEAAASGLIANAKLRRFLDGVSANMPIDSGTEANYSQAKNDLYAARHILFLVPKEAPPASRDSIRRKADQIRAQLTTANFAQLAKTNSQDPQSAVNGGDLGVFPRGMMVKPFGDAVAALKLGEISPVVETEFGYHIIQRNTWDQVKDKYAQQAGGQSREAGQLKYMEQAKTESKAAAKDDAATTAKAVAKDPLAYRKDKTVLATSSTGNLTAGDFAMILLSEPRSGQLLQQIQQAPDSMVKQFVLSQAQRGVLLKRADSAKVGLSADELTSLRRDFVGAVKQSWQSLGIDPKSLADSAKTPAERERLAAARIEAYLDKVMTGQAQPLPVLSPLQLLLMDKYDAKVNSAGIDRAVERAQKIRASADSARAATQPKSAVPLPGGMGGGPGAAPGGAPSAPPSPAPAQPAPARP
jgi:peptidyl-prolyl cis-trans isomerase D